MNTSSSLPADSIQLSESKEAKYVEFEVSVEAAATNLVPPTSSTIRSDAPNERLCLLAVGSSPLLEEDIA